METPIKPKIPLALEPLREASGSEILTYGMTIIGGEQIPFFTVSAESPLLSVPSEEDAEPTQELVVRHGAWLAVSGALSSKPSDTTPDREAVEDFLEAENDKKKERPLLSQRLKTFFTRIVSSSS